MVFAYLILAHKNPHQLHRLVNILSGDNVFIFVHVDCKSYIDIFKDKFKGMSNVIFCDQQKQVTWGGFGMIEATLELMRTMYSNGVYPDYVHLMSGQDFPLKTKSEIDRFFLENKGKNFLEAETIPSTQLYELGLNRIQYKWFIEDEGYEKAAQLVNTKTTEDDPYIFYRCSTLQRFSMVVAYG